MLQKNNQVSRQQSQRNKRGTIKEAQNEDEYDDEESSSEEKGSSDSN